MTSPPGAPLRGAVRGLRVAALGGASLLLACGAHLVGGGRLPSAGTLAVVAAVLGLVAVVVTARRCRIPVVLPVLGLEQTALHYLFSAASSSAPLGCVPSGHQHLASVGASCLAGGHEMAGMGTSAASLPMLVGHALAVLGTAWLLVRGEAWLWAWCTRLVRATVVAISALPTAVRLGPPVGAARAVVTVPGTLGSPRGPPVWAS
jgi:hypothetical protein